MPLPEISIKATIQIFILYLVIYSILRASKGSRVGQVLMGVGIIAAAMVAFTYIFRFDDSPEDRGSHISCSDHSDGTNHMQSSPFFLGVLYHSSSVAQ